MERAAPPPGADVQPPRLESDTARSLTLGGHWPRERAPLAYFVWPGLCPAEMQTVEPSAWQANGFADQTDRTGKTKRIRATPAIVPRTSLRRGRNCPDCGGCVSWCSCPATTGVPVASDRNC